LTFLGEGARVARGATYMFLQHLISLEEMGVYAIITFILAAVQILGVFALPSASTKYIAQYMAEGHPEKAKSVITRVLQISSITSIVLLILLYLGAEWLSVTLLGTREWIHLFQILAVIGAFTIFYIQIGSFLRGLQKFRELAALSLAYTLMQKSLVIFLLLYTDLGLYSIAWSWLTSVVVACFIGLFLTARSAGILAKPHPVGTLARFSYPLYISNSLSFVAGWVDQIFILPFLGAIYLGMYHLAVRAVAVPSLIASSVVIALFPKLSELYTRHGKAALTKAFGNSTRYAVLAGFPIVIGIASLSHPILVIFAGPDYAEAALPLAVLCFSVLPTILGVAIGPTLMTLERTKIVSMMIIVAIFSSTAVSYVTLAYLNLGMFGTALARVLSSFAAFGYGIYALRGLVKTMFDTESLWKTSLACLFMAIAIVSMSCMHAYFLEGIVSQTVLLLVSVLLGAAVYFCGVVALRTFKKQDIELLNESLPDKLKRVSVWLDRLVLAD